MERRCYDQPLLACTPGTTLCDDFEGPLAGWYAINYNHSTLTLDAVQTHSGHQALHAGVRPHDPAAAPPDNISQAQVTQAVSIAPDIFMRFYFYQSWIFPNYVEIAALQENRGDYRGASLWLNTGKLEVDAPIDAADAITPMELTRLGNRLLPEREWTCIEWQIHVGVAEGSLRAWINDEPQDELYLPANTSLVTPTSGQGTVVVAGLGFFTDDAAPFPSYDVWFDDIAVSSQRIGCLSEVTRPLP
jgi:hypothetical protein